MAPRLKTVDSLGPNRRGSSVPMPVKNALLQVLSKYNLDKDFARYEFVLKWKEIVGEEIAKRTRPECFRNGALVVAVANSAWAQELTFNKRMILNRLKKHLSESDFLNDVVFYVGNI